MYDKSREAPVPKISSMCVAFPLTQYQRVTDRQTDTDTGPRLIPALSQRSAGKKKTENLQHTTTYMYKLTVKQPLIYVKNSAAFLCTYYEILHNIKYK